MLRLEEIRNNFGLVDEIEKHEQKQKEKKATFKQVTHSKVKEQQEDPPNSIHSNFIQKSLAILKEKILRELNTNLAHDAAVKQKEMERKAKVAEFFALRNASKTGGRHRRARSTAFASTVERPKTTLGNLGSQSIGRATFKKREVTTRGNSALGISDLKKPAVPTERKALKEDVDVNVDIKLFTLDLSVSKVYKSFKDYRFWMQQSQLHKIHPEDWETAADYLQSGLRELPLNIQLLYNYAAVNEKLARYDTAIRFFKYVQEIRPRWADALFGQAVTHFKLGEFKLAKRCIKLAIQHYKNDSFERIEVMQYFKAMCYKNLGKFKKAKRDYGGLLSIFRQAENESILQHIIGIILLPIQEDRKSQHEFMENTVNLISFFQPCLPFKPGEQLSAYLQPNSDKVDVAKYGLKAAKILLTKKFFNRFSQATIIKFLSFARVEYFQKDEIIFLSGRVGVVTHGSVRVMSHESQILNPQTIGRYREGRILGHGESDNKLTLNSQTWFITFDKDTEVVFFDPKVFNKLWSLQSLNTQKLILSTFLQNNFIWQCLSEQTRLNLVFDAMEVRKYRPGQLICRMSKHSALSETTFGKFFRNNISKFKDDIENAKILQELEENEHKVAGRENKMQETLMSRFVKLLTEQKKKKKMSIIEKVGLLQSLEASVESKDGKAQSRKVRILSNNTKEESNASCSISSGDEGDFGREELAKAKGIPTCASHADLDLDCETHISDQVKLTSKRLQERLKHEVVPFDEKYEKIDFIFKDHSYPEVDGLYFVYHGYADVVAPGPKKVYTIGLIENFGESKLIKQTGFENFGDIFAGLYPRGISNYQDKTPLTASPFTNMSAESTLRQRKNIIKSKLREAILDRMNVHNLISADQKLDECLSLASSEEGFGQTQTLMDVLRDDDDCVLCIYIPYAKLYECMPTNEIRKMRNLEKLQKFKDGVVHMVSQQCRIDHNWLKQYK